MLNIYKVFINSCYEIIHGLLRYVGTENCSDGAPDDCHVSIFLQCFWGGVSDAPSGLDKRLPWIAKAETDLPVYVLVAYIFHLE